MSWLEDIQNHRQRQVEQMTKAFGYENFTIQKARAEDDGVDYTVDEPEEEEETLNKSQEDKTYAGKSDMYKMRMLGLRKFNEQDQKEYIGVEDADNSYITNLENGDIIIGKIAEGYLVSKFPVDTENEEGDEQEVTDLSEAIDVALQFKDDLEDVKEPEQIMYKETEKAFEDEINPFEKEAWKASLSKAELDEFEKAKLNDKIVNNQSAFAATKKENKVVHDINGTKVTVTKNTDGSYTLEANGKKVKSDDPSYFVNGTNLKPSVKKALAKEIGL